MREYRTPRRRLLDEIIHIGDIMESVLSFEAIWEDEHMIEVRVFASNKRFSATVDFYTTRDELKELAISLKHFPNSSDSEVKFRPEEGDDIAPCSLQFNSSDDHNGHISLRASLKIQFLVHKVFSYHGGARCNLDFLTTQIAWKRSTKTKIHSFA